jgi:hypothetical protein
MENPSFPFLALPVEICLKLEAVKPNQSKVCGAESFDRFAGEGG